MRATKKAMKAQGTRQRERRGRPRVVAASTCARRTGPISPPSSPACIAGGVDVVQLRDKELEARPLIARARLRPPVCRDHGVPFVLNDRPDLALEVGADGVHVGQDDAPVVAGPAHPRPRGDRRPLDPSARTIWPGRWSEDVSYLSAGPVEPTPTKPGRPGTGVGYVTLANARSSVPVFVTGGVTPERIPALAAAGSATS